MADLRDFYGIRVDASDEATLSQILHERIGRYPEVDDVVLAGPLRLCVREVVEDRIEWVASTSTR